MLFKARLIRKLSHLRAVRASALRCGNARRGDAGAARGDAPRSVLCRAPESGGSARAEHLSGRRDKASSLSHVHGDEN